MFLMEIVHFPGTADKRISVFSNDAPLGHKSLRKTLKSSLTSMYGPTYNKYFISDISVSMTKYFTPKEIDKIINFQCMDLFQN